MMVFKKTLSDYQLVFSGVLFGVGIIFLGFILLCIPSTCPDIFGPKEFGIVIISLTALVQMLYGIFLIGKGLGKLLEPYKYILDEESIQVVGLLKVNRVYWRDISSLTLGGDNAKGKSKSHPLLFKNKNRKVLFKISCDLECFKELAFTVINRIAGESTSSLNNIMKSIHLAEKRSTLIRWVSIISLLAIFVLICLGYTCLLCSYAYSTLQFKAQRLDASAEIMGLSNDKGRFFVKYQFEAGTKLCKDEMCVRKEYWNSLEVGDRMDIEYLSKNPDVNHLKTRNNESVNLTKGIPSPFKIFFVLFEVLFYAPTILNIIISSSDRFGLIFKEILPNEETTIRTSHNDPKQSVLTEIPLFIKVIITGCFIYGVMGVFNNFLLTFIQFLQASNFFGSSEELQSRSIFNMNLFWFFIGLLRFVLASLFVVSSYGFLKRKAWASRLLYRTCVVKLSLFVFLLIWSIVKLASNVGVEKVDVEEASRIWNLILFILKFVFIAWPTFVFFSFYRGYFENRNDGVQQ